MRGGLGTTRPTSTDMIDERACTAPALLEKATTNLVESSACTKPGEQND